MGNKYPSLLEEFQFRVDCPLVTKIDVESPLSSLGSIVDIISV